MKKCIGGTGLSVTGALLLFPLILLLDWNRVRTYGLFHELNLYSPFPLFIFLLSMLLLFGGIVLILVGVFASDGGRGYYCDYEDADFADGYEEETESAY